MHNDSIRTIGLHRKELLKGQEATGEGNKFQYGTCVYISSFSGCQEFVAP